MKLHPITFLATLGIFLSGLFLGQYFMPARVDTGAPSSTDSNRNSDKSFEDDLKVRVNKIINADETDEQIEAIEAIGAEWAGETAKAALEFEKGIENTKLRRHFKKGVMKILADTDPAIVLDSLRKKAWWPDSWEHERSAVIRALDSDVKMAKLHYLEVMDKTKSGGELSRLIASRIAEDSVEDGLQFASNISEDEIKSGAYSGVIGAWMKADLVAAGEWITQQPVGETRDQSTQVYALQLGEEKPADAFLWATTIDSVPRRAATLTQIVRAWKGRARADDIKAAVTESGIAADEKSALLKLLDSPMTPK